MVGETRQVRQTNRYIRTPARHSSDQGERRRVKIAGTMLTTTLLRGARLGPAARLQDVLVDGGQVAAIGDIAPTPRLQEVLNVAGRVVLPGLWDHHVHFDQWAQVRARIDLSRVDSAAAAARLVAAQLRGREPRSTTPIVGYGFRDALWPDEPHRDVLDRVASDVPVVLLGADLHCAWLNTAALRRFGEPDHPTGLLREEAAMRVVGEIAVAGDDVSDSWAADAASAAAARGVVGIVDMEKPWPLPVWRRRMAAGNRSLRVVSSVWPERLDELVELGLHTGDSVDGTDGLLRAGPLKVITDGSLNTRTAYCHDPYVGFASGADAFGLSLMPLSNLEHLMRRATAAGLECAIHAIGDHANALSLQAFTHTGARGSIEHAQLLDDDDVQRFADLSVVASVQPEHAMDDRDVADRYWAGRTRRAFPLRALLDAGAVLALGSDAPVAPLDPWVTIAAAVHRTRDGRARWHPEQEITVSEALAASTPHWRRRTSIGAGDPADLIVLDDDPFSATPDGLRTMSVAATMLAGRWTYQTAF
jgi:predicted amidohydrolase YtcJ